MEFSVAIKANDRFAIITISYIINTLLSQATCTLHYSAELTHRQVVNIPPPIYILC